MKSSILFSGYPIDAAGEFNVYVDLFNKGDFNEIRVIPEKKDYQIMLEDIKLATITKTATNSWIKVDGNMPREKLEQIGNMISLRLQRI